MNMVSLKSVLKFQEGNSAMRHVWYAQYTIAGIRLNPPPQLLFQTPICHPNFDDAG